MVDEKDGRSPEAVALRRLFEVIQSEATPGSTYKDGQGRHVVSLNNPRVRSSMRAAAILIGVNHDLGESIDV